MERKWEAKLVLNHAKVAQPLWRASVRVNAWLRLRSNVMFTAFVLLCAQNYCFAVGGPAYVDENECIADFMQNGVPSLQMKYPTYTIKQVKCYEWEKQVKS